MPGTNVANRKECSGLGGAITSALAQSFVGSFIRSCLQLPGTVLGEQGSSAHGLGPPGRELLGEHTIDFRVAELRAHDSESSGRIRRQTTPFFSLEEGGPGCQCLYGRGHGVISFLLLGDGEGAQEGGSVRRGPLRQPLTSPFCLHLTLGDLGMASPRLLTAKSANRHRAEEPTGATHGQQRLQRRS